MGFLIMTVGDTIKSLREDRGYSQKQLAKVLSISAGCLSKYENGKTQIPLDLIIKIADVLNVSVDYLLGRNDLPFDYKYLRGNYIGTYKVSSLLNDALSLGKTNRASLATVIGAMKCKDEVDRINAKKNT